MTKVTIEVWEAALNAPSPDELRKILLEVDTGCIHGGVLEQIPMVNEVKGVTSKKNRLKEIRSNPNEQRQLLEKMNLLTEDESEPTCARTDDTSDNKNTSTERDSLLKERDSLLKERDSLLKKLESVKKECDHWRMVAETRVENVQESPRVENVQESQSQ